MVKRKSLVIPITVVSILVVGAYLMNNSTHRDEAAAKEQPKATTDLGTSRGKENKDDIKKGLSHALASGDAPQKPVLARKGPGADDPLINKKVEPQKPKPAENAVGTQWWKDGSASANSKN